jgi:transposase
MVRRPTAREKLRDEESLRQCIRPVCGDVSPGHDEIRQIPGIGPVVATAIVAAIGNGAAFHKGRDFAAWLGMCCIGS